MRKNGNGGARGKGRKRAELADTQPMPAVPAVEKTVQWVESQTQRWCEACGATTTWAVFVHRQAEVPLCPDCARAIAVDVNKHRRTR